MDQLHDEPPSFWRSPAGWALALVVAVGGFYLVTSTPRISLALPYLFLVACPLMHAFMHRGHGHKGHDHRQHRSSDDEQRRQ